MLDMTVGYSVYYSCVLYHTQSWSVYIVILKTACAAGLAITLFSTVDSVGFCIRHLLMSACTYLFVIIFE